MDVNNILKLLYKGIKSSSLKEISQIEYILNGTPQNENNIFPNEVLVTQIIAPIYLPKNRVLLVKDFPINFFLAKSVLVGDKIDLVQFSIKGDTQTFISSRRILKELSEHVVVTSVKKTDLELLRNQPFSFSFRPLQIIKNLDSYLREKKNIELFNIHIVHSNSIDLFVPSVKRKHLRMAQLMNIPTPPLLEGEKFRDTSLSYKNEQKLTALIKPLVKTQKEILWYTTKNKELTYKDTRRSIQLLVAKEELLKKVSDFPEIKSLISNSAEHFFFEIGRITGDIPLPLWTSKEDNSFVKIRDSKHFKELAGVDIKISKPALEKVYIQDNEAKKAHFEKYYITKFIEDNSDELFSSEIFYSTKYELLLKIFLADSIKHITYKRDISTNSIKEVEKLISSLNYYLLSHLTTHVLLPKEHPPKTLEEIYLYSLSSKLLQEFNLYKHSGKKKKVFKIFLQTLREVRTFLKSGLYTKEKSFYLLQFLLSSLVILDEFDPSFGAKIKQKLYDLNISTSVSLPEIKRIKPIEKAFRDLAFLKKFSDEEIKDILIIEYNSRFSQYYPQDISTNSKEPLNMKFVKIHKTLIRQHYPSAANEIISKLENFRGDLLLKKNILIGDLSIPLTNDYFTTYEKYNNFKLIKKNKYFAILRKRSSYKKS